MFGGYYGDRVNNDIFIVELTDETLNTAVVRHYSTVYMYVLLIFYSISAN